jgi:hypothetical protein
LAAWIHQCQAAEYQRQQHEAAGALDHVQIDLLTSDATLNAEAGANAGLTTVFAFDPLDVLSAPEQHLADFYDVEELRTRAEQSKQVKRTRVAEEYLHDYHYAVAEGHFQPSWYQQAVVFAWGLLVPNTGPRRVVEYADGTVSVELAAEPDTGFLAGQASSMAGMGAAAGSAKTLAGKMAIAGRELLEEGIESAIQYASGLPIPLVRPSRGSTRPRVESGKVPEVEAANSLSPGKLPKTVYHYGDLSDGVSGSRPLSTSPDPDLTHYHPNGDLYRFDIPSDVYEQWILDGSIQTFIDYHLRSGITRPEIRIVPPASSQMNDFLVPPSGG